MLVFSVWVGTEIKGKAEKCVAVIFQVVISLGGKIFQSRADPRFPHDGRAVALIRFRFNKKKKKWIEKE